MKADARDAFLVPLRAPLAASGVPVCAFGMPFGYVLAALGMPWGRSGRQASRGLALECPFGTLSEYHCVPLGWL